MFAFEVLLLDLKKSDVIERDFLKLVIESAKVSNRTRLRICFVVVESFALSFKVLPFKLFVIVALQTLYCDFVKFVQILSKCKLNLTVLILSPVFLYFF